jgi:hypothetical protein
MPSTDEEFEALVDAHKAEAAHWEQMQTTGVYAAVIMAYADLHDIAVAVAEAEDSELLMNAALRQLGEQVFWELVELAADAGFDALTGEFSEWMPEEEDDDEA